MTDKAPTTTTIDRQSTTPFLLNFCYRSSGFHSLSDFPVPSPSNPHPHLPAHLQVYTWPSCTLRELAHILTGALPSILPDPSVGTRLSFRLVFPDTRVSAHASRGAGRLDEEVRGRYTSKEMGSVVIAPREGGHTNGDAATARMNLQGDDADKTLADVRFVIGDFIDCAVFPPLSDGSVAPSGTRPPPRGENGYGRVRGGGYGGGRGGGGFGGGVGRGADIPSGEWRRGERLPESGFRGGFSGRGRGRGGY